MLYNCIPYTVEEEVFQGRHSATLGTILDEISVFLTSRPTAEVN